MKHLILPFVVLAAAGAGAVTVHRSFCDGYPAEAQGAAVRQYQNRSSLSAPKTKKRQTASVTNRVTVVVTREQAEKLMKNNQRYKKVKTVPATGSITNTVTK